MTRVRVERRPIHLEQKCGKPNRQRIWEVIRQHRDNFSITFLADEASVNYDTTQTYLRGLKKAGIVAHKANDQGEQVINAFSEQVLYLVQDYGIEAPRVLKSGKFSRAGEGTEAMWRTLRMLSSVTAQELATYASAQITTTPKTAQSYLLWLCKAGYVKHDNSKPRRYSLIKAKIKGPRAPQIQRIGQVYDPNTAEVVYAQNPEDLL